MLRLLASDLDGTFVAERVTVSRRNLDAVAHAHRAGIPFVVATGRPSRWVRFLHPLLDHDDPLAVVSNGAEIIRLATGESLHCWPLDADVVAQTASALAERLPGSVVGVEWGSAFGVEPGELGWQFDAPQDTVVAPLPELLRREAPILKLLVMHPRLDTEALYEAILPELPASIAATFSYLATPGIVELSAAGVSKARALQVICDDLGIDARDVAAFGDMPNDLEMLHWAGAGYVMPTAHSRLLTAGLPVMTGEPTECVGRTIEELIAAMAGPAYGSHETQG